MRSDRRIKYYSTPLVRASVTKKLSALLSIRESDFENYFDIQDLEFDKWNNVMGLEVKPVLSPHPVENNVFFFRAYGLDRDYTYAHLADTAAFDVLDKMAAGDYAGCQVPQKLVDDTKKSLLQPVDLKKIDIGGGLIHGNAKDYADDTSRKLMFCHISRPLDQWERARGQGAPFGASEQLIPSFQEYIRRSAFQFVKAHFTDIPNDDLLVLLNNPTVTFNPESILMRAGERPEHVLLMLTGSVEYFDTRRDAHGQQGAGSFIGEYASLTEAPAERTYRAKCFVKALQISVGLYRRIFEKYSLTSHFYEMSQIRRFLQQTWLFGEALSNPVLNRICRNVEVRSLDDGDILPESSLDKVYLVRDGAVARVSGNGTKSLIEQRGLFGESVAIYGQYSDVSYQAIGKTKLFGIPPNVMDGIPVVQWKLLESFRQASAILETAEAAE
jgi:hemerythrin